MPVVVFSPAKLNLFLAITGRRSDGFHELVSVVVTVDFGDTLWMEAEAPKSGEQGAGSRRAAFGLACSDPALAVDDSNLVVRAARLFAETTGWRDDVRFSLQKRIPMGAGLGGGSSNATATLRGLNMIAGRPLKAEALAGLAAQLGSDCPLFLQEAPVVMRGRGERVEVLPAAAASRLAGRRVLIFKPDISINTAWAYRRLAQAAPGSYLPPGEAEARLQAWMDDATAPAEALLFNNLEAPAFAKFLALPTLLAQLKSEYGLAPRMSGSGSACYALLPDGVPTAAVTAAIRAAWGPAAFVTEARIRG
ncbi:MAG TPA: 4-(cytidine 5'-diphospho)-2-C-methyl-D-erythritol kinase [Opitutaceae bacterium]